jgi:plasmid replication initiation protein
VQFNYLNSDRHKIWLSSPLLSTCELNETTGELEYEFTDKLAALLVEPALYSYISLKVIYQFESKYGLILYEILKRYADRDAAEPYWPVKTLELRDLLGCRDKLKDWANFRLRALNPALEEINALASFNVEMDEIRQGRGKGGGQVVGVVFRVARKAAEDVARAAAELDKPRIQRRGERRLADQEKALRWLAMSDIATRSMWERRAADLGVTLPPAATAVENLPLWVPAIAEVVCRDEGI